MDEDRERREIERQGAGEITSVLAENFESKFPESRTSVAGLEGGLLAGLVLLVPVFATLFAKGARLGVAVARQEVGRIPLSSWAVVEALALDWAGERPDIVLGVIQTTTTRMIRREMSAFYRLEETMPQLRARLRRHFGAERAARIATTETTRVFAEASMISYENSGIQQMQWFTANDDRVCPICAPLGGLKFLDGAAIPAREEVQERRGVVTTVRGQFIHPGGLGAAGRYSGMPYQLPAHVKCRCRAAPVN